MSRTSRPIDQTLGTLGSDKKMTAIQDYNFCIPSSHSLLVSLLVLPQPWCGGFELILYNIHIVCIRTCSYKFIFEPVLYNKHTCSSLINCFVSAPDTVCTELHFSLSSTVLCCEVRQYLSMLLCPSIPTGLIHPLLEQD